MADPSPSSSASPAAEASGSRRIIEIADRLNVFARMPSFFPVFSPPPLGGDSSPPHTCALLPVRPPILGTLEQFRGALIAFSSSPEGLALQQHKVLFADRAASAVDEETFSRSLGNGVEAYEVVVEDDSPEGRRKTREHLERVEMTQDGLPGMYETLKESYASVHEKMRYLHRLRPGRAILTAPRSNLLAYRLSSVYHTAKSMRRLARHLRRSKHLSDHQLADLFDTIRRTHAELIKSANQPFLPRGGAATTKITWLEALRTVSPDGNGKGVSSFSISFVRRDISIGILAPAAPMCSYNGFSKGFAAIDDENERLAAFELYQQKTEDINRGLGDLTRMFGDAVVLQDCQKALRLRRHILGTLTDGIDNIYTQHWQANIILYPSSSSAPSSSTAPHPPPRESSSSSSLSSPPVGEMSSRASPARSSSHASLRVPSPSTTTATVGLNLVAAALASTPRDIVLDLGLRFGTLHADAKDDDASWSILSPLGILPPGSHGGCFFDPRSGTYIEWDPKDPGLYLFRGVDPHVGTPPCLPPSYSAPPVPGQCWSRSVIVAYPSKLAARPQAPVTLDALDLLLNRELLNAPSHGLPFLGDRIGQAAAGGVEHVRSLLIRHKALEVFAILLQSHFRWEHYEGQVPRDALEGDEEALRASNAMQDDADALLEGLSEVGMSWASVVRAQALTRREPVDSPLVRRIIACGNPFGFVTGETSTLFDGGASGRRRAIRKANEIFALAASSVLPMRNMVKAAWTASGEAFMRERGYRPRLVAASPPGLLERLADDHDRVWTPEAVATELAYTADTVELKYEWRRIPAITPLPPAPPVSTFDHLFPPDLLARRMLYGAQWDIYAGSAASEPLDDSPFASFDIPATTPSSDDDDDDDDEEREMEPGEEQHVQQCGTEGRGGDAEGGESTAAEEHTPPGPEAPTIKLTITSSGLAIARKSTRLAAIVSQAAAASTAPEPPKKPTKATTVRPSDTSAPPRRPRTHVTDAAKQAQLASALARTLRAAAAEPGAVDAPVNEVDISDADPAFSRLLQPLEAAASDLRRCTSYVDSSTPTTTSSTALTLSYYARLGVQVRELWPKLRALASSWYAPSMSESLEGLAKSIKAHVAGNGGVATISDERVSLLPLVAFTAASCAPACAAQQVSVALCQPTEELDPTDDASRAELAARVLLDLGILSLLPGPTATIIPPSHILSSRLSPCGSPATADELASAAETTAQATRTHLARTHSNLFLASSFASHVRHGTLFLSSSVQALFARPTSTIDSAAHRDGTIIRPLAFDAWEVGFETVSAALSKEGVFDSLRVRPPPSAANSILSQLDCPAPTTLATYPNFAAPLVSGHTVNRERKRRKQAEGEDGDAPPKKKGKGPSKDSFPERRKKLTALTDNADFASVFALRRFLGLLLVASVATGHAAAHEASRIPPPLPAVLSPAIDRVRALAASAPSTTPKEPKELGSREAEVAHVLAQVQSKPYRLMMTREWHPHRRLAPPFTTGSPARQSSFADRIFHTATVRLGLVGAAESVYRAFPAGGLSPGNIDNWLASAVAVEFASRDEEKDANQWGRTNCYGQPAKDLKWDSAHPLVGQHAGAFAASLAPDGSTPFVDAVRLIKQSKLPGCASANSLSRLLLAGDLAHSSLIQHPSRDEMGKVIAEVSRGAQVGLVRLGFLKVHLGMTAAKLKSETAEAFKTFYDVVNGDAQTSGISDERRQALKSIGVDLANAVLLEISFASPLSALTMTVGGLSKSVVYRATAAGELEVVYRAQSMQDVVKILQKEIQFDPALSNHLVDAPGVSFGAYQSAVDSRKKDAKSDPTFDERLEDIVRMKQSAYVGQIILAFGDVPIYIADDHAFLRVAEKQDTIYKRALAGALKEVEFEQYREAREKRKADAQRWQQTKGADKTQSDDGGTPSGGVEAMETDDIVRGVLQEDDASLDKDERSTRVAIATLSHPFPRMVLKNDPRVEYIDVQHEADGAIAAFIPQLRRRLQTSIGANAPKYVVLHAIDSDFYIVISSEDSEVLVRPMQGSFDIIFRSRLEARADFGLLKTKKSRCIASILISCDLAKGLHGIGWVKFLVNDKLVALANRDWQVGEDAAMADALRDALGKEEFGKQQGLGRIMSLSEILRRVSILLGDHVDEGGLVDKRKWEANARRSAQEKADELLTEKAKAKTSDEPFHNIEWPCDRRPPPPSSASYARNPYTSKTTAKATASPNKPLGKFASRSRLRHHGTQLNAGDYNNLLHDAETFVAEHERAVPLAKAHNERARTAKKGTAEQAQGDGAASSTTSQSSQDDPKASNQSQPYADRFTGRSQAGNSSSDRGNFKSRFPLITHAVHREQAYQRVGLADKLADGSPPVDAIGTPLPAPDKSLMHLHDLVLTQVGLEHRDIVAKALPKIVEAALAIDPFHWKAAAILNTSRQDQCERELASIIATAFFQQTGTHPRTPRSGAADTLSSDQLGILLLKYEYGINRFEGIKTDAGLCANFDARLAQLSEGQRRFCIHEEVPLFMWEIVKNARSGIRLSTLAANISFHTNTLLTFATSIETTMGRNAKKNVNAIVRHLCDTLSSDQLFEQMRSALPSLARADSLAGTGDHVRTQVAKSLDEARSDALAATKARKKLFGLVKDVMLKLPLASRTSLAAWRDLVTQAVVKAFTDVGAVKSSPSSSGVTATSRLIVYAAIADIFVDFAEIVRATYASLVGKSGDSLAAAPTLQRTSGRTSANQRAADEPQRNIHSRDATLQDWLLDRKPAEVKVDQLFPVIQAWLLVVLGCSKLPTYNGTSLRINSKTFSFILSHYTDIRDSALENLNGITTKLAAAAHGVVEGRRRPFEWPKQPIGKVAKTAAGHISRGDTIYGGRCSSTSLAGVVVLEGIGDLGLFELDKSAGPLHAQYDPSIFPILRIKAHIDAQIQTFVRMFGFGGTATHDLMPHIINATLCWRRKDGDLTAPHGEYTITRHSVSILLLDICHTTDASSAGNDAIQHFNKLLNAPDKTCSKSRWSTPAARLDFDAHNFRLVSEEGIKEVQRLLEHDGSEWSLSFPTLEKPPTHTLSFKPRQDAASSSSSGGRRSVFFDKPHKEAIKHLDSSSSAAPLTSANKNTIYISIDQGRSRAIELVALTFQNGKAVGRVVDFRTTGLLDLDSADRTRQRQVAELSNLLVLCNTLGQAPRPWTKDFQDTFNLAKSLEKVNPVRRNLLWVQKRQRESEYRHLASNIVKDAVMGVAQRVGKADKIPVVVFVGENVGGGSPGEKEKRVGGWGPDRGNLITGYVLEAMHKAPYLDILRLEVNEAHSSSICPIPWCRKQRQALPKDNSMKHPKRRLGGSPVYRLLVCTDCRTRFHRDVVGCMNIMWIGLVALAKKGLHALSNSTRRTFYDASLETSRAAKRRRT